MENFGKFCLGLILITFSTIAGGFVFSKLWEWFIVPPFSAPIISITQSIGICILLTFAKPSTKKDKEELSMELIIEQFGRAIGTIGFMLLLGWIVTLFL